MTFAASAASIDWNGPGDPWTSHQVIAFTPTIGGETISAPPGTPPPSTGKSFKTRFHSNYFNHDETGNVPIELHLSATFRCTTIEGAWSDVTVSTSIPLEAHVYNYGTCFGISEFEEADEDEWKGVPYVAQYLEDMNHYVTTATNNWNENSLQTEVEKCTVFYLHSHANSVPRVWGQGTISVDYSEVKSWLQGASSPHVPVNLAFMDSCENAKYESGETESGAGQDPGDPTLNHGFSTNGFLYETAGGACIDRAQLGWRVSKYSPWTKTVAIAFWGSLEDGETVSEARDIAIDTLRNWSGWGEYEDDYPSEDPDDYLAVFGDYYMCLWGVYTGTLTENIGWYVSFY